MNNHYYAALQDYIANGSLIKTSNWMLKMQQVRKVTLFLSMRYGECIYMSVEEPS